jgi:hypothetical protein
MSWFTRRSAVSPRRPTPARPRVEALEGREVPAVQYFGGNLLPHVEAQALYLGNEWSAVPADAAQTATTDAFLKDLTGGAYMQALSQAGYGVSTGTASPGAVDNTPLTPGGTITDATIQAGIQADINKGLLQAPDANRLYVVYVEPNVAVSLGAGQGSTQQGVLGYHGAFAGHDAAGNPATVRYAVVAYPGGTAHNSSLGTAAIDQLTAVTSHELAEAVTDPDINFGRLGWYDPRRGEIGDITENNPSALVRLDGYLVQQAADRNDQLLVITPSTPPPVTPPAPPPVTPPTIPPVIPPVTPPAAPVGTTTSLHYSVGRTWFGLPTVTLTVTVAPGSGLVAPDGTVALVEGGRVLAKAKVHLVNGVAEASFSVVFFAPGSFTFDAVYLGNGQFQGSTSNSLTFNVF